MKRLLFVQPTLQPPCGGNGVAVAMIEALKDAYDLTVLTWTPVDLDAINRFYGTGLRQSDFVSLGVPARLRAALARLPTPSSLLLDHLLLRYCKRLSGGFDAAITANNEADFGIRGIQYVHFPWAYLPRPLEDLRWYHRWRRPVEWYRRLCLRLSDFSTERMKRNLTLANSAWTAARVRSAHGIDSVVLHPALPAAAEPAVAWSERAPGFVCIGRINPQKRIERIIDILAGVRRRGHDVHLHVVGTPDGPDYLTALRRHAAAQDWISFDLHLDRGALLRVLATHRFGIHGMTEEHFGLAMADVVQAGGIPFVPAGGGQLEIVGNDPRICYDGVDEAVDKISAVLESPPTQAALRESLAARRDDLSMARFAARLRALVSDFLSPRGAPVGGAG